MRFKGTLVLLVLGLALGSFIYFYEIKGGEQRAKAKQTEGRLWSFEENDVQQLELTTPERRIAAVRKGEKAWEITAPRALDADAEELDRLVRSAATLQRESEVESDPADRARYGLSPARFSVKLKTKDGREFAVDFGADNPTGSFSYASLPGQKAVFLVPSSAAGAFDRKVDDLRNRSVLRFEPTEARSLRLESPKGTLELFKDGDDRWWFQGFEKRAADGPEVRGILNALSSGRVREFLDGDPGGAARPGLENPFIDVRVACGEDRALRHLVIGPEKSRLKIRGAESSGGGAGEIYLAKDASRPDLFFVEKDLVDKLLKVPDDIRDKALASVQRWDVDSIVLANTRGRFHFVKSGGEWFLGDAKKKAKWDAVNGILDAMEKAVKEWIDRPGPPGQYGLDQPAMRVVLKQGAGVLADVAFGRSAKEGIYARVKGDPCVKVADAEGLDKLDRPEADFVEAPAAGAPQK